MTNTQASTSPTVMSQAEPPLILSTHWLTVPVLIVSPEPHR
jgi:hypothetical protein